MPPAVADGQLYRLVTSAFLQYGPSDPRRLVQLCHAVVAHRVDQPVAGSPNPLRSLKVEDFTQGHAVGTSTRSRSPRPVSITTRSAVRIFGHGVSGKSAGLLVPKR